MNIYFSFRGLALVAFLITLAPSLSAQELRCQVTVNGQRINGVDPVIFTTLQTQLNDFINSRVWTTDQFSPEEKIECSLFLNIAESPSQDNYKASATIQASRPVFNSSYNSTTFNFIDNSWNFTYVQNAPLEFNANQYTSNIVSLVSFYVYTIIGLDYESMAKGGGAKYFSTAEQIMNSTVNALSSGDGQIIGWRSFDGQINRNRYQLNNSMLSSKYESFRQAIYEYHHLGMDNFYEKPAVAHQNILNALDKLDKIARENPNNILLAVFFQAKSDELLNVFSGADMGEKAKALSLLRRADASNAAKYDKLMK
ncbi:MAG: DUF4835 family protein [Bacteroidetes bacterium]|nr:DUF4835 family protein [Bacteroidota bacterium]